MVLQFAHENGEHGVSVLGLWPLLESLVYGANSVIQGLIYGSNTISANTSLDSMLPKATVLLIGRATGRETVWPQRRLSEVLTRAVDALL